MDKSLLYNYGDVLNFFFENEDTLFYTAGTESTQFKSLWSLRVISGETNRNLNYTVEVVCQEECGSIHNVCFYTIIFNENKIISWSVYDKYDVCFEPSLDEILEMFFPFEKNINKEVK